MVVVDEESNRKSTQEGCIMEDIRETRRKMEIELADLDRANNGHLSQDELQIVRRQVILLRVRESLKSK